MKEIKEFINRDQFAKHSGIELLSVALGQAIARMTVHPWHLNGVGTVQGGAIFTLADFAFAAACNSHGKVAVAGFCWGRSPGLSARDEQQGHQVGAGLLRDGS